MSCYAPVPILWVLFSNWQIRGTCIVLARHLPAVFILNSVTCGCRSASSAMEICQDWKWRRRTNSFKANQTARNRVNVRLYELVVCLRERRASTWANCGWTQWTIWTSISVDVVSIFRDFTRTLVLLLINKVPPGTSYLWGSNCLCL